MKLCASTLRGLDGRGNRKLLRDRHTNTHTRHTSHTPHTHKTTTATLTAHACVPRVNNGQKVNSPYFDIGR